MKNISIANLRMSDIMIVTIQIHANLSYVNKILNSYEYIEQKRQKGEREWQSMMTNLKDAIQ